MQTMQQVFDRVALHLLQQGRKSLMEADRTTSVRCAYRGEGGLKCAVGFLISDEAYNEELESCPVHDAGVCFALNRSGVSTTHGMVEMLGRLQSIHDNAQPERWLSSLQSIAASHGLTMPALAAECQSQAEQPVVEEVATKEEHAIPELY